MKVEGRVTANIQFCVDSGPEFMHSFIVADVSTGPILGADFLNSHGMEINFQYSFLRVGSVTIPFSFAKSERCSVVLADDVVFSDDCYEVIARARILRDANAGPYPLFSLFQPREELSRDAGVLPAHAVVNSSSDFIPVRLISLHSQARLRKGKIIGTLDDQLDLIQLAAVDNQSSDISPEKTFPPSAFVDISNSDLDPSEEKALLSLIDSYHDVFLAGEHDLGRTDFVQHEILTEPCAPKHCHNYRQPQPLRVEAQRQVDMLLEQDVIEPSTSPWNSPVLMVPKKDGSFRFCVDFRKLNSITQCSEYPIPRVDDCVESLSGSMYFTTLDLAAGYWQVEVKPEDRSKTAFSTAQGHYQFCTMPMGLKGAPATFQRLMDLVLRGLHWSSVLVYLDDIIVFSRSFSDHLAQLEEVFQRLRSANLKLKPSKCSFAQLSVTFLGHVVSRAGVHIDPEKTNKIAEWPIPVNVTELRSFLGLAGYYRRFIETFSTIAAPLTDLTKKRVTFQWSEEHTATFNLLKRLLCSAPILAYPEFSLSSPFTLKTDASDIGLGAILVQLQNGVERVVAYGSRKLNTAERNYSVPEREALAVVWGISHFRPYLYGRKFRVLTDHQPITYLKSVKDPKGRFARWLQELSGYDYEISYKPGSTHKDADALSRYPHRPLPIAEVAAIRLQSDSTEIQKAQREDSDISLVMKLLTSNRRPAFRGKWRVGKLRAYRRVWHQLEIQDGLAVRRIATNQVRLLVPSKLRHSVLEHCHDKPASSHLGIDKTFHRVKEEFYWPGYAKDVDDYVSSCHVCQERNPPPRLPRAQLQPITASRPFEIVAMDMLELPRSTQGNKYCLVISDYFTRWPEVFALPNQSAMTVAKVLVDGILTRHSMPEVLFSDRGGSFDNEVIKQLCRMVGMTKVRTTPYHPQSNGLVERINRTLLQMLSKAAAGNPKNWDQHLQAVVWAYRTSLQPSVGFTPFRLLYGRNPLMPGRLEFSLPFLPRYRDARQYLSEVEKAHRQAVEIAEEFLGAAQGRQIRNYDVSDRYKFAVGDLVLVHDPALRHGPAYKLVRQWTGPFKIEERLGKVNYHVRPADGGRGRVIHYNRMKPYKQRIASSPDDSSACGESSGNESADDGDSGADNSTDDSADDGGGSDANDDSADDSANDGGGGDASDNSADDGGGSDANDDSADVSTDDNLSLCYDTAQEADSDADEGDSYDSARNHPDETGSHNSDIFDDGGVDDGGVDDGGIDDGGVEDGGVDDGGVEDGGVDDGGVEDGGVEDGVVVDDDSLSTARRSHRERRPPRHLSDYILV